jgi:hypothetical protein
MNEADVRPRYRLDPVLSDFLILYARFEFAMKRTAFSHYSGQTTNILVCDGGGVTRTELWQATLASWQAFGKSLPAILLNDLREHDECKLLWETPPNTFGRANGSKVTPDWGVTKPVGMIACDPLEPVRKVRNMMAHGDSPGLQGRGRQLVNAALFVLETIILRCQDVEAFASFLHWVKCHQDDCDKM